MMTGSRRAVFLDRDGTMLEEAGYLDRLERLVFFPYTVDAVRLLNRAGFAVVVVTNQAGVARGLFDESFVEDAHRHMTERLGAGGARVDGYYYCPHHPEGSVLRFRQQCDCRKPLPGMVRRASADLGIDPATSFIVGDRWHDLETGQAAGARGILVRTGYGRSVESVPPPGIVPVAVADNLIEAVSWILREP
jgi:D-glycero-D-manno-heptose 1,7-bisphosphate phosphatase